mmetsp:Transcript_6263/g.18622  ORF Transcript_6263/g.18622 Transcript_6263/m.18622 type:complete len:265 (-) Transcript_6263:183-977(-)
MASAEAWLVVALISQPAPNTRLDMRTRPTRTESIPNSAAAALLLAFHSSPSPPGPSFASPASLFMLATCKNAKIRPRLSNTVDEGPSAASSTVVAHRPTTAVSTADRIGEAKLDPRAGRANRRIAPTSSSHELAAGLASPPGSSALKRLLRPTSTSRMPSRWRWRLRWRRRWRLRRRAHRPSEAAVAVERAQVRSTPLVDAELPLRVDGESLVGFLALVPGEEGVQVEVILVLGENRCHERFALPVAPFPSLLLLLLLLLRGRG